MYLVSVKEMLQEAERGRYAVGHFNLNNMESVRAFLLAAQETQSPIILGVSGGTAKYMGGGYRTITDMVQDFMHYLDINVPVALHVDHGKYEEALAAIDQGFISVMFDGSSYPIEENIAKTKEVVRLAHVKGISVEAEVGGIGGEEDGKISMGECAESFARTAICCLRGGSMEDVRRLSSNRISTISLQPVLVMCSVMEQKLSSSMEGRSMGQDTRAACSVRW